MKILIVIALAISTFSSQAQINPKETKRANPVLARAPLRQNPFIELPLGAIKPKGWLREMLVRQQKGATGYLDQLYPSVMGSRNGWLGGDGDQWERGPYWIDGLLPLAYILDNKELIAKARPWVEWAINSQTPDGHFGPTKDYPNEPGLQRNNSRDWWPKMVMLKVLKQYYSATGDKRVTALLTNYFKYQLKELPQKPLDYWTFWSRYRAADNLMVVYWLYNITGEKFLLELGDLIYKQTFDYPAAFSSNLLSTLGSIHCVNLAQGIKTPAIYYQHHPDAAYLAALKSGFSDLTKYNGMAHGLFGGDEALHGNNPTQGSELCSAVEMMFSLESILEITGDPDYADRLEKIAFNALPSQTTEDYVTRQYFQQANQVMATRHARNFAEDGNHRGTDLVYGVLTGYPCCTSNMHQGWPKFTQNLWYATPDRGLAALVYSPSEVTAPVAQGRQVTFVEETNYPFEEAIQFTLRTDNGKAVSFPFYLRIPEWCKQGVIRINGKLYKEVSAKQIIQIEREWQHGDIVELMLPMHIFNKTWYENSVSLERGPITYALKIGEQIQRINNDKDAAVYGHFYYEVRPTTPWNYGLFTVSEANTEKYFKVENKNGWTGYPWMADKSPISIKTNAMRIPSWQLYNEMAGPLPFSIIHNLQTGGEEEEITLIPYGCTKLRISQFPVVGRK